MKKKVDFSPKLYLGDSMNEKDLDKLKKNIVKKPLLTKVYLITISSNPVDQLDIIETKWLVQRYYYKNPLFVVGIASDYQESLVLLERIVLECLGSRGDCSLKEYLLC